MGPVGFEDYFDGVLGALNQLKTQPGLGETETVGDHLLYPNLAAPDQFHRLLQIFGTSRISGGQSDLIAP